MQLLNVGCGRCYHPAWTNIDLVACGPGVRAYDLRRGLPYDDNSFDAVYHSHVLEHLTPEDAAEMLAECHRVLRIGGVLRIAVPDLEGIARTYLQTLDSAANESTDVGLADHQWMTFELIDQMTRRHSGGQMGPAMRDANRVNHEFIRCRIGHQVTGNSNSRSKKTLSQRATRLIAGLRKQLAIAAVTVIDGKSGRDAYREGSFRQSGEIHRWMYDRVSLGQLLREVGFDLPQVCSASESRITEFDSYQLDRDGDVARKPDSLYMEAVKPAAAQSACSQSALSSIQAA